MATSTRATSSSHPAGAAFLLDPLGARPIFTPEGFSDEQRMFRQTCEDFMRDVVLPASKRIEAKEDGLMVALMRQAGELGLLMIDIPEAYGGLGADKTTSMLAAETLTAQGSFATAMGAHTGIGTLPIVYFGTAAQKQRYLPKLATGELIAAYALTEAGSGSDALAAKTKAVLSPDGKHYVLNGSKMWITNGRIADLFIVFAKIDGEQFTGFLVERGTPGFVPGAEEHKLGIRGSSTTALTFEDCAIPADSVLGEIGKGHRIAFNILNLGRLKLGVAVVGGGKAAFVESLRYAKERKQFGKALAEFGLIQEKLADMAWKIYTCEAMGYRASGLIDAATAGLDKAAPDHDQQVIEAVEEYNIEASICKVYGSERMSEVIDQAVQLHGGYGYSEEYAVERAYRDVRINRIFEGTNEINRLLIPGTIIKRSIQQRLALVPAFAAATRRLADPALLSAQAAALAGGPLAAEARLCEAAKAATLVAFQHAFMKYMVKLADQQEVLGGLADLIMDCYALDSVLARAHQSGAADGLPIDLARVAAHEIYGGVAGQLKVLIDCVSSEQEAPARQAQLAALPAAPYYDLLAAKRRLAAHFLEVERYVL